MMNVSMSTVVRKLTLLLLLAFPVVAVSQTNKKSSPPPAKPAAAPAQKAPASNTSHPATTNNNTSRPGGTTGNSNMSRPGGTSNTTAGHNNAVPATHGGPNNGTNRPATNNMSHPGGGTPAAHNAGMGHTPPGHTVSMRGGGTASIRPNGQVRSINRNGMTINRGLHGGRTVVSTHNGVRVVTVGHGGYVQRAYVVRGGRSYYSRTYYYGGAYRVGVYRGYYWGGRPYYGYYPGFYYHPVYYGWAYNPWPAPVYYGWGWGAAPWYGYYGPYYAPYPVYPSAAFWLTDFMIAASLQAAYAAQAQAWLGPDASQNMLVASLMPIAPPDSGTAKLSPEVKNQISDEVKMVLAGEQADASKPKDNSSGGSQPTQSNEAPPALDPKFTVFLVSSDLSLTVDGNECALGQGDVIQRTSNTADGDGNVSVKVLASSKSDCAVGTEGPISTDDLQEMYNSFRESVKDGMGDLAKKNGTGGLPKAPDTSTTDGDVPAPPPDKSAEKSLSDQQSAADQAEAQAKQDAASGGSNN
jgi:hypothetical protein